MNAEGDSFPSVLCVHVAFGYVLGSCTVFAVHRKMRFTNERKVGRSIDPTNFTFWRMARFDRGSLYVNFDDKDGWIRASDLICWRGLDEKPCRSVSDRQASDIQTIIIPILFAKEASVKSLDHAGIISICHSVESACSAAGVSASLDRDLHLTPGFKFNLWENRGVAIRVEIGSKEAASGSACLSVHPHYACDPQVQRVMSEISAEVRSTTISCPSAVGVQSSAPSRRLQTPLEDIGPSCMRILQALPRKCSSEVLLAPPCSKLHIFKSRESEDGHVKICVDHVKYLVGLGRRCHCGVGHVSFSALKSEIGALSSEQHPGRTIMRWGRRRRHVNGEGSEAPPRDTSGTMTPCGSSSDEGEGPVPCTVFVGNLPIDMRAIQVQAALEDAFAPFASASAALKGDCRNVWN